jgi:hypothetical protein
MSTSDPKRRENARREKPWEAVQANPCAAAGLKAFSRSETRLGGIISAGGCELLARLGH